MNVRIQITVSAESRGELIDSYAATYRAFREHVEKLQADGHLPPGPIRWLLKSGEWSV